MSTIGYISYNTTTSARYIVGIEKRNKYDQIECKEKHSQK